MNFFVNFFSHGDCVCFCEVYVRCICFVWHRIVIFCSCETAVSMRDYFTLCVCVCVCVCVYVPVFFP